MCVHVWISFFENPKMFVWHEKCSFDNPVENFSPKVRKLFARTSKIITKLYFSSKSITRGNNIFARKRFSIKERAGGGGVKCNFWLPNRKFFKSKSSKYKFNQNWILLTKYTVSKPTVNIRWHCKLSRYIWQFYKRSLE